MSPPRLAIDNLSVRIGGIDAVRDVSLSIAPGPVSYTHLTLPTM